MYDHQEKWPEMQGEILRKNYARLLGLYESALLAQSEGVFEVSVRSQTVALSISLDGFDIAQEVIEAISRKLTKAESDIKRHAIDNGETLAWERRKEEMAEEQRSASNKRAHEEYAAQGRALAEQATPTFNTKPGRARKAAAVPCLKTSEQAAYAAIAVPMNASAILPTAQATNLPQG